MAKSAKRAGYQEIRGSLSIFGWIWRILFLGWQAVMIILVIASISAIAPMVEAGGDTAAGAVIGGAIGLGVILPIWVGGTIILGIFVLLTRRTKAMVPIADTD